MTTEIGVLTPSEISLFAASELARCLRLMADPAASWHVTCPQALPTHGIALALADDPRIAGLADPISRSDEDDAVAVAIEGGRGTIVGANERSILIGVYRFLHHLGCRWVRPGAEGEHVPRRAVADVSARFVERASLRHRAICIEGAVSLDHVLDLIDWAPKVGFSDYFLQFPDGYAFFERWYGHANNRSRSPEPFGKEAARAFTVRIEAELRRRGLTYHGVGHGWTCQAIGLDLAHWNPVSVSLPDATRRLLAEVDGKRDLRWDRPMITSLCFSQEEVRHRLVEAVVAHAQAHPEVDLLHVWIDDGARNKCECPECSKTLPSQEYVAILQRLDAALTAAGCPTRIVFIAYTDLLWPPPPGTPPLDPKRFVFLYANSRHDYRDSLSAEGPAETPAYVRNRYGATHSPECFRGFLRAWQAYFPDGERLLFEYYGCGPMDQFEAARVIHADVAALAPLGFHGLVNCQAQRVFFPTGLPCYVLGQSLWDARQDLDALRDDYFLAAFGQDGGACKEFVKVAAEVLNRAVERGTRLALLPGAPAQLERLTMMIEEFERVVARNAGTTEPCHARSWRIIGWYVRFLRALTTFFGTLSGGAQAAVEGWREARAVLEQIELHCEREFDLWAFVRPFDRYVTEGRVSGAPEDVA